MQRVSPHLLWFPSSVLHGLQLTDTVHGFVRFTPKYSLFRVIVNAVQFLTLVSKCSLLVYRNGIEFCVNLGSCNFTKVILGIFLKFVCVFYLDNMLSVNRGSLFSFQYLFPVPFSVFPLP